MRRQMRKFLPLTFFYLCIDISSPLPSVINRGVTLAAPLILSRRLNHTCLLLLSLSLYTPYIMSTRWGDEPSDHQGPPESEQAPAAAADSGPPRRKKLAVSISGGSIFALNLVLLSYTIYVLL